MGRGLKPKLMWIVDQTESGTALFIIYHCGAFVFKLILLSAGHSQPSQERVTQCNKVKLLLHMIALPSAFSSSRGISYILRLRDLSCSIILCSQDFIVSVSTGTQSFNSTFTSLFDSAGLELL